MLPIGDNAAEKCSAKKFQNWGQCPTTFDKVGTFPEIVGHKPVNGLEPQKSYGKQNTLISPLIIIIMSMNAS